MPKKFVTRASLFVAGVVACAVLLFARQSTAAADRLFGNATYFTSCPYVAETVTLANGEGVVWNHRFHVSLYYEGHYVYGDFNGDGLKDAAVTIGESGGGSDNEISLAFLINEGGKLVHRQSIYLDDSATIRSVKVRDGKVIVDMLVHRPEDCHAGPTKHVRNVYAYDGPDRGMEGTPLGDGGEVRSEPPPRLRVAEGVQGLPEIYKTPIPAQIRQTFDQTTVDCDTCAKSAFIVRDGDKSVDVFSKKFLVIGLDPEGFSGMWVTLVFEGVPHAFRIWLYEAEDGKYVLRTMAELPEPLDAELLRQIQSPAYREYWL